MADWGVTDRGFRRKAYQDIIADMETKAKDLFGANIDLSSASPLALFLRVVAFGLSLLWMVAETVYNAAYVDTATGQSLDYVVKYAGISRRPASHARRMLRFTGDSFTVISAGFLVETPDGPPRFATLEDAIIPADGTVDVLAEAVEAGTGGNVAPGSLTAMVNPIPGIESVTNVDDPANIEGLDQETDRELRERYEQSLARGGASTLDSILASVLEAAGVRAAKVFHNPTSTVDGDGRPPKSVEVVVLGGADEDVAQAIHETIAAGIESHGQIEVEVIDAGGETQLIRFNRAQVVPVYVSVEVAVGPSYPLDGDGRIKDEIIRYIGGTDSFGELHPGIGLGEPVIWTAVIEAARSVTGVRDVSVQIGKDPGQMGTSNIPLGSREVAETSIANITVTRV